MGEDVRDVTITLKDVDIEAKEEAAVSIGAGADVTIELDGDNKLTGGNQAAGIGSGFAGVSPADPTDFPPENKVGAINISGTGGTGVTTFTDVPVTDPSCYIVEEATNSHDYTRRTELTADPVWEE